MSSIILILMSILFPPLGVLFKTGVGFHFVLNLFLTLLGYLPGIIHALWVVMIRDSGRPNQAGIN